MSDEGERAAVRWVNRGHNLDLFVDSLTPDVAQAVFDRLAKRIGGDGAQHDHPPRPACWACGSPAYRHHEDTCHAMLSVALAAIDYEDRRDRHVAGDPTNRQYYGMILERGRAAGADMKALRRDPNAIERWTQWEPPDGR